MYNVLIADDEAIVRKGIINNIDWESLGLCVIAEAADGVEALEIASSIDSLDIALLDISMPKMDGLTLAEQLKRIHNECKTIIITGFDDFDYARRSLRIGVYDYILKPITRNELIDLLSRVCGAIDLERSQKSSYNELVRSHRDSLDILLEKTLNALIRGEYKDPYEKAEKLLNIGKVKQFACALVDVDEFGVSDGFRPSEDGLVNFSITNIANEILQKNNQGIGFSNYNGEVALLFFIDTDEEARKKIAPLLESIKTALQFLYTSVSIGCSDPVQSIKGLQLSYEQAQHALDYRFVQGPGRIIYYSDIKLSRPAAAIKPLQDDLLRGLGQDHEPSVIQNLFAGIEALGELQSARNAVAETLVLLFKAFDERGVALSELVTNQPDIITMINQAKTIREIEEWTIDLCQKFRNYIESRSSTSMMIAMQVREYIDANYKDPDLTFRSLCNAIHISSSYMSLIFKKEFGKTCVDYITSIRIEKAKELLLQHAYKTYEVAEHVGFSSPNYFCVIFKKATGFAPTEYREKHGELQ